MNNGFVIINRMINTTSKTKGFTLIELLIVIGILGILAAAVVVVLNPAELLAQARDTQRIQDMAGMNSALSLYAADLVNPDLNGAQADAECSQDSDVTNGDGYVAVDPTTVSFTARTQVNDGTDATQEVDENGWLPVNLTAMSTGSPLSVWPVDPTNSGDSVYRYACDMTNITWELNATLESIKFATTEDMDGNDGGDTATFYEVGTEPGLDL